MEEDLDTDFDEWFYTARSPDKDMPWGTHLIYEVCDNDPDKFEIGCKLLLVAFKAGKLAQEKKKEITNEC